MSDTGVTEIAVQAIIISAKLGAPILLVTLGVGLAVALLQSITQVQEMTLSFVPKLMGVALVLALGGSWMLAELVAFTQHLFDMLPDLIGST